MKKNIEIMKNFAPLKVKSLHVDLPIQKMKDGDAILLEKGDSNTLRNRWNMRVTKMCEAKNLLRTDFSVTIINGTIYVVRVFTTEPK